MGQGGGPEGPEYTTVTVQEPQPEPEGSRVEESLLPPWILPETPPEPAPHRPCCHKLPEFLRRVSRTHLLVVIAVLILTVIFLAASLAGSQAGEGRTPGGSEERRDDLKDGAVLPPCDDGWIWYRNKCYYFSEAQGNWAEAEDSCAALNSSLALIDTQKELDFLLRNKGDPDHWIGLKRDSYKQWRWINGTEFNNWFTVADHSDYAYLNHHNVKSGESYNTRHWICSKVSTYERKYKREKTVPSFH